jgi:flavin-dependent dehydrogenase
MSPEHNFYFQFSNIRGELPRYAYNVPRDKFDDTLLNAARQAGVKIIEAPAAVEKVSGTDKVKLGADALTALGDFSNGQQPNLIVDATGRVRLLPKLLGINAVEGGRKDTALFAHVDQAKVDHDGHVHSTRLDHGWSWRIPLPDRMSLGIVIGTEHLSKFGATKEDRYDNLLKQDSVLNKFAGESKRLTPVMEYTNYQLVSSRLVGNGWALVGDTAGFIDPVFSSGLLIGLTSATELADAIRDGRATAFQQYERGVIHHLQTWHEIVNYYYDGRMFTSFRVGELMRKNPLIRLTFPHINKHMGRIFTGAAGKAAYSMAMMRFLMKHGIKDEDPQAMAIR